MLARFGQVLSRFVPMTEHDVQEILQEQALSRRRFGDIALSWGLCRPDHIWQAWSAQLAREPQWVDLGQVGIDTQALAIVDPLTALDFQVLPLRVFDSELIVAASESSRQRAAEVLPQLLNRSLRIAIADASSLFAAIKAHYARAA